VSGQELERMGIASRALPADEVLPAALAIAEDIARNASPLSVGITKKLLWESTGLSPAQVEHRETQLHHHLMKGTDAVEGVMAYVERREPKWSRTVGKDWPEWPDDSD
jgi:enoyl-CoA hydratase/carnithine racemase